MSNIACILDLGSGFMKAGYSGDPYPRSKFWNCIAKPYSIITEGNSIDTDLHDFLVGNEVVGRLKHFEPFWPVIEGEVSDWDDLEKIIHHTLYRVLYMVPEDHPVLVLEVPELAPQSKELMIELMVESFNVPKYYSLIQPLMSLYATGRSQGLVIESGADVTSVVPVDNGLPKYERIQLQPFAGRQITEMMLDHLQNLYPNYSFANQYFVVDEIKKKYANLLSDNQENIKEQLVSLPDGFQVDISSFIHSVPDNMFNTKDLDDRQGLVELIERAVDKLDGNGNGDQKTKNTMYSHIVLSGGNTFLKNFQQKLQADLKPENFIDARENRDNGAWMGGSIVTKLSSFHNMWVSKEEYYEYGQAVIQRKNI